MPELTARARDLRQHMTDAERLLWSSLRRRVIGAKFRRQVPLGAFIVDFACVGSMLVIEVDGGQHLESSSDVSRDGWRRTGIGCSGSGIMRSFRTWRGC